LSSFKIIQSRGGLAGEKGRILLDFTSDGGWEVVKRYEEDIYQVHKHCSKELQPEAEIHGVL
jgi:hypothetical protein